MYAIHACMLSINLCHSMLDDLISRIHDDILQWIYIYGFVIIHFICAL